MYEPRGLRGWRFVFGFLSGLDLIDPTMADPPEVPPANLVVPI
ncbi:MAG: hypothetical protein AB7W16_29295 [Candidatus Obscuribacterales bacterium]